MYTFEIHNVKCNIVHYSSHAHTLISATQRVPTHVTVVTENTINSDDKTSITCNCQYLLASTGVLHVPCIHRTFVCGQIGGQIIYERIVYTQLIVTYLFGSW